jgi:hypothetical protein
LLLHSLYKCILIYIITYRNNYVALLYRSDTILSALHVLPQLLYNKLL